MHTYPIRVTGAGLLLVCLFAASGASQTEPQRPLTPINVIAIGYDIENNPKAQQMLQVMAQAARDGGAQGEVILIGKDEAALHQAMQQAMAMATTTKADVATVRLEIKTLNVRAGEKIVVTHSDFPIENQHAWIAFYANADNRNEDYLHYTFLANLTDRTFDVIAPARRGDGYHFRIFLSEGYEEAARSPPVQVAP